VENIVNKNSKGLNINFIPTGTGSYRLNDEDAALVKQMAMSNSSGEIPPEIAKSIPNTSNDYDKIDNPKNS
jgi:hypothetical protein